MKFSSTHVKKKCVLHLIFEPTFEYQEIYRNFVRSFCQKLGNLRSREFISVILSVIINKKYSPSLLFDEQCFIEVLNRQCLVVTVIASFFSLSYLWLYIPIFLSLISIFFSQFIGLWSTEKN